MRCEGMTHPGAFMFAPQVWTQCNNEATVMIKFKQDDEEIKILPGCPKCWQECIDAKKIKILSVKPILEDKE